MQKSQSWRCSPQLPTTPTKKKETMTMEMMGGVPTLSLPAPFYKILGRVRACNLISPEQTLIWKICFWRLDKTYTRVVARKYYNQRKHMMPLHLAPNLQIQLIGGIARFHNTAQPTSHLYRISCFAGRMMVSCGSHASRTLTSANSYRLAGHAAPSLFAGRDFLTVDSIPHA